METQKEHGLRNKDGLENKDSSENVLLNGSTHLPKRGRGRPRGSPNKKFTSQKPPAHNPRTSKKVNFFSPEIVVKSKVRKRGRPKKLKILGRPRKIPYTAEEESEILYKQSLQRKRKISKPLGRPRIHPIVEDPKNKRARGRPRKYPVASQNDTDRRDQEIPVNIKVSIDGANNNPRKRGRPLGSFKKKRGRPPGSSIVPTNPSERGAPAPGGEVKNVQQVDGPPRKRGRPPGSRNKVKIAEKNVGDSPRTRGPPPAAGKIRVCVPDEVDLDLDIADGTSAQQRKRGRPNKVRLAVVLEKLPSTYTDEEINVSTIKPPCDSDPASPNETTEDLRAGENRADDVEEETQR